MPFGSTQKLQQKIDSLEARAARLAQFNALTDEMRSDIDNQILATESKLSALEARVADELRHVELSAYNACLA